VTRKRLGEILVAAGVLDESALRAALAEQKRAGVPLGKILVERGTVEEADLVFALSRQLEIPEVNLDEITVDTNAVELVSLQEARQHAVLAFGVGDRFLDLAMADPTSAAGARFIDELQLRTRLGVRAYIAGASMIERAIEQHYG
jgi:hypothetical protein